MATLKQFALLAATSLLATTFALPKNHTDSLVNAAIDNGTFADPSVFVRPRFRYWLPDASVDQSVLANDVKIAKVAGAGGVEVLGYYLYGGTPQGTGDFAPDDWAVYGWGTEKWNECFQTLAQAHKEIGGIMGELLRGFLHDSESGSADAGTDFAMGPDQGQVSQVCPRNIFVLVERTAPYHAPSTCCAICLDEASADVLWKCRAFRLQKTRWV